MTQLSLTPTAIPTPFGQTTPGLGIDNVTVHSMRNSPIISYETVFWTQIIGSVGICSAISVFGVVANIINIVVFIRQGVFSDSSTVSLFCLAISDLLCLVFLLWLSVCFALTYFPQPGLPFDLASVTFITAGRPHVMFTQFTRWITFFISFERCMCVLFPFKVSTWFSPFKTAIMVPSLVLFLFFSVYLPMFSTEYLRKMWDPRQNRTIITGYRTSNHLDIMWVVGWLAAQGYQPAALLGVFICTQVMTIRLNVSRKWRQSTTATSTQTAGKQDTTKKAAIGSKDKRLVQMIRVICIVFLICYSPDMIATFVTNIDAEIMPGGEQHNLFFFLYTFTFNLEALNSGINILIYYKMSSKYKKEFDKLFGLQAKKG